MFGQEISDKLRRDSKNNARYVFERLKDEEVIKSRLIVSNQNKRVYDLYLRLKIKKSSLSPELIEEVSVLPMSYSYYNSKVLFSKNLGRYVSLEELLKLIKNSKWGDVDIDKSSDDCLFIKISDMPENIKLIAKYYSKDLYDVLSFDDVWRSCARIWYVDKNGNNYLNESKPYIICHSGISNVDEDIFWNVKLFCRKGYSYIYQEFPYISRKELDRLLKEDGNLQMGILTSPDYNGTFSWYVMADKSLSNIEEIIQDTLDDLEFDDFYTSKVVNSKQKKLRKRNGEMKNENI